ncbi:MAG: hypothetical protein ORN57_02825 [Alphaproteobacteria bacterium]|nr:hypothetical protein [Alphaproteobacteria bacterium]
MAAAALLTIPFTIASMVVSQQQTQTKQEADNRALDIAAQQQALKAQQDLAALTRQQQAAQDSLKSIFYRSGIDPTQGGSAQNALTALSQKSSADLSTLEQDIALKSQALNNNWNASYNPFPTLGGLVSNLAQSLNLPKL